MPRKIHVFISWSKSISKELGKILNTWLPLCLRNVKTYFSDEDIQPGDAWFANLQNSLSETDYGIICITQQNINSPWIYYEAGAMMEKVRICPCLFGVKKSEFPSPFDNRQCVEFPFDVDKTIETSFYALLASLNDVCKSKRCGISKDELDTKFKALYPSVKRELKALIKQAKKESIRQPSKEDELKSQIQTLYDFLQEFYVVTEGRFTNIVNSIQSFQTSSESIVYNESSVNQTGSVPSESNKNPDSRRECASQSNENSRPDALEIIIGQGAKPLPVSLGYLEHCLDVLSAFPLSILKQRVVNDENGKPDKGRREVITRGKALIRVLRNPKNGCDEKRAEVREFQKRVKQKLSIPSPNDDITYANEIYGSPVSMKAVREALDAVIANILLYLKSKEEST